jgi:ABC-2 type transport system ATP-binding protein
MLKVDNISKDYGRFKPIRDVSFRLERGEVLGLLGANGAGKSTTLNMLAGYFPPSSGAISFDGFDLITAPIQYKQGLGYLPEIPPLYPDMTIAEQLTLVCSVKGIPKKDRKEEIDRVCRMGSVLDVKNRLIKNMSKGYRQRIGLAQALIGSPGLLILDEPLNGLDPQQIIDVRELIKDIGKNHAVIISSHILSEIASVSTRIQVLNKGYIVADRSPDELLNSHSESQVLKVRLSGDKQEIMGLLESLSGINRVDVRKCSEPGCMDYHLLLEAGVDVRKDLSRKLPGKAISIMQMKMTNPTLEEIFIELTSGGE